MAIVLGGIAFSAAAALAGCASSHAKPHEAPAESVMSPKAGDIGAIYARFLDGWMGDEGQRTVNVDRAAAAPTADELEQIGACARQSGLDATEWVAGQSVEDLGEFIHDGRWKLVDRATWKPADFEDLVASGKSAEFSARQEIDNGLLRLSAIAFDKKRTMAALTYRFVCGALYGEGGTALFARTPAGWVQRTQPCGRWISRQRQGLPRLEGAA